MLSKRITRLLLLLVFRLPAPDAGGRRRELPDLSLLLATRLRPHLAGLSDPLSGRARALHHGAVSQQQRGPLTAQATQRGQSACGYRTWDSSGFSPEFRLSGSGSLGGSFSTFVTVHEKTRLIGHF